MSALRLAVSALNRDKPHSSITDWVEILTSLAYHDEAYDGIPDLAASISLQSTGYFLISSVLSTADCTNYRPSEASRAIRKKIKHGDNHQKYRALVVCPTYHHPRPLSNPDQILKALMENAACVDDQLIDAIKHLASDPTADIKVRKKLRSIIASWSTQFKNDPSLSTIASLYKQPRTSHARSESADAHVLRSTPTDKDAAKKRAKQEKQDAKERARKAEEEARQRNRSRRAPFNFEAEKPQILTSIANASQASSNLVNAITLVNRDKESIIANARVQECLENARAARKAIVRYIQVSSFYESHSSSRDSPVARRKRGSDWHLIETNERVVSALEMYDDLSAPQRTQHPTSGIQAAMNVTPGESERALSPDGEESNASGYVHPDLQDLSFGGLDERASLPPPIRPSVRDASEAEWDQHRGSLSDFSDYESEEERHPSTAHLAGSSTGGRSGARVVDVEDPFADPFAD
ncbi:hypothetical protein JVT61DRAFT_5394 [Boletus reticuloceps]|uniref:VHS domain-containing protein n=1 Tax=Boletus reticuloceps TaxID=495285 RepID=A0A8I2YZL8_9AGAM|nr:hypothetical protein JVT61DRAFT_5394 [Boletus reticuloceps]